MAAASEPVAALPLRRDGADRERFRTDLDTARVVEAGAGSGKTTALVDRVVALVTTGTVELRHLAAIPFTEKAGAELRDRVRRKLEEVATNPDPVVAERCRSALAQLAGAAKNGSGSCRDRVCQNVEIEV